MRWIDVGIGIGVVIFGSHGLEGVDDFEEQEHDLDSRGQELLHVATLGTLRKALLERPALRQAPAVFSHLLLPLPPYLPLAA